MESAVSGVEEILLFLCRKFTLIRALGYTMTS